MKKPRSIGVLPLMAWRKTGPGEEGTVGGVGVYVRPRSTGQA